jgi:hypothetical protein
MSDQAQKSHDGEELPNEVLVYITLHALERGLRRIFPNLGNQSREGIINMLNIGYPRGHLYYDQVHSEYKLTATPDEPTFTIALQRVRDVETDYWKGTTFLAPKLIQTLDGKDVAVRYAPLTYKSPVAVHTSFK